MKRSSSAVKSQENLQYQIAAGVATVQIEMTCRQCADLAEAAGQAQLGDWCPPEMF